MTATQIITFIVLGILICVSYFVVSYSFYTKTYNSRFVHFVILWLFVSGVLWTFCFIVTLEMNNLKKQVKEKCLEYEKIENVYRLKQ
jgi:heme/copper-type cytochrome/quinol oxidase subunit 2